MSTTFLKSPLMAFFNKWIRRKYALDQVIAIVLLCFSLLVIFLSFLFHYYKGVSITATILVGALVYLLFRNKLATDINMRSSFQFGSRIRPLCHIIFVISLSLMIYVMWGYLYNRPPVFFILLLVATVSCVFDILSLNETNKLHITILLFKIIILSIVFYLSIYHEYPRIWGIDAWWHNQWTQETINLGHITQGEFGGSNDYYLFPLFHIWNAITQIITQVSTYNAVFLGTGVMIAISSLFIFLIGEKLVNAKAGLLAALIMLLTDQTISRTTNIIPMSLAFCMFPALLYIILTREKKGLPDVLLMILLSTTVILTHTIAALVTLLSMIILIISIVLFNRIGKPSASYNSVPITLIAFFGLFMLFRWMQPRPYENPFFDVNIKNLVESFQGQVQFVMTVAGPTKAVAPVVTVLDDGGYILLVVFGIIGALTYLHYRNRTGLTTALVSLTAFLIIVPQLLTIFSVTGLLPDRWNMFSYVVLSLMAAAGLFRIASIIPGNISRIGVILLIVLAGTFMMTNSSGANADSPMVFNGARRVGYTQSEFNVINTLYDIGGGRPMTDEYYFQIFPYIAGYDQYRDWLQRNSRVFIQRNYYLRHPEWNKYYTGRIRGGPENVTPSRELISDYMHVWGIDNWPIIYRNNNVTVYSNASLVAEKR
jgi:hypothetical protein